MPAATRPKLSEITPAWLTRALVGNPVYTGRIVRSFHYEQAAPGLSDSVVRFHLVFADATKGEITLPVVSKTSRSGLSMPRLTKLQGQYVAFIYSYTRVNGRPPAESDVQRYFGTTAPAVHDMILRLETCGAIEREPWTARSVRVLVPVEEIPPLD